IKNRETGFLVQCEDEMVEMTRQIQTLDRARCRKWVEERFSVAQMVDGYEQLYRRAVSGNLGRERESKQSHAG
ncbi:MAG TPA: glycosyltransferase family 4 protein, partial [Methylomirabilota bacterium]|nr:glycosyltransferase family 4 protein [Methylomirabilota bacterium]